MKKQKKYWKALLSTSLILPSLFMTIYHTSCFSSQGGYGSSVKSITIYELPSTGDDQWNFKPSGSINCYFYNDTPNVPYVNARDYIHLIYDRDLNLTMSCENNRFYTIMSPHTNAYLKFDIVKNELCIHDIDLITEFSATDLSNNQYFYLKTDSISRDIAADDKTISLDKYNVKVYANDNGVFVPFDMLKNIIKGPSSVDLVYSGDKIFVFNFDIISSIGVLRSYPAEFLESTLYGYAALPFRPKTRPTDLAKHIYNQLCLCFDNCRGITSQLIIGDDLLHEIGLNYALKRNYPHVRELLNSTNPMEYWTGIVSLFELLYDGGHTSFVQNVLPQTINTSIQNNIKANSELTSIDSKVKSVYAKKILWYQALKRAWKTKKWSDTVIDYETYQSIVDSYNTYPETYITFDQDEQGNNKICYLGFDEFYTNYNLWYGYYKYLEQGNKQNAQDIFEAMATTNKFDSFAFIKNGLDIAKKRGVKNVVVDISTNGGGDTSALIALTGLFNGAKCKFPYRSVLSNGKIIENYSVDVNLDGKFNDDDVTLANTYRDYFDKVCFLVSPYSFSCGNFFPFSIKSLSQDKYKIIGDKSGGGSCAITLESTIDGMIYIRSSDLYFTVDFNGNEQNLDLGLDADYHLDATDFFNVANKIKEI